MLVKHWRRTETNKMNGSVENENTMKNIWEKQRE